MPIIRECSHCGRKNRVPAQRLASAGRCGACKSPLAPIGEPLAADEALFDEVVHNAPVPVLVDFWAEWCEPCRAAAPEVARAAKEMAGEAIVLKVDSDQYPQLAARYGVRGIPNFIVFSAGRKVMQQAGPGGSPRDGRVAEVFCPHEKPSLNNLNKAISSPFLCG